MSAVKIVRVAIEAATLYVVQVALAFIPNCELVTTLIIVYTLIFGREVFLTVEAFALIEIFTYGLGLWNFIYLYIWSILVLLTLLFKNVFKDDWIRWSLFSGLYGLLFGTLCTLEYLFIDTSLMKTFWITGLPWDVWHGFTNFLMTMSLGKVTYSIVRRIANE